MANGAAVETNAGTVLSSAIIHMLLWTVESVLDVDLC